MSELSAAAKRDLLARLLRERAARPTEPASEARAPGRDGRGPALGPIARDGDLAPSFGQERVWFLEQLQPESLAYNLLARIGFSGTLDVEALRRSVETLVARHEVLRTTFPAVDGRPVQRIAAPPTWVLPLRDLRALPDPAREAEAERLTRTEVTTPFDLATGPLLRTVLLRLADDEHVLVLTIHHIVSDGWSLNLLFRELAAAYEAIVAGTAPVLPTLPVQYADFAQWQRGWLTGEVLEAQRAYWMDRLSGDLPVLDLPTDRPRAALSRFGGATRSAVLNPAVLAGLRELSRREGVTLFTTLLAAFKTLLLRYTGQEDVIVGTPVAGRVRPEIERLMGFFVNTLALRTDLSGDPSFREALRRTRNVVVNAHAHADFPFERLVEELQPQRDLSRGPVFQVVFNMLSFGFGGEIDVRGLRVRFLPALDMHAVTDGLMLYAFESRGALELSFVYSTSIFDADTIGRLEGHFHILLAGVAADPDRRLSALPLLPADECRRLLVDWNATDVPFPLDDTFAGQLAAQVARTPGAVAVVADEGTLTYGELDARAGRIARHLVAAGVGPDRVVGLLGERSLDLLTWILAVFKAGGAYLPLDPRHPAARHASILSGSGAVVVLVDDRYVDALEAARAQMDSAARPVTIPAGRLRGLDAGAGDAVVSPSGPGDLAYVIYTSGSTGVPKGAMVEQVGMLNHLYAKVRDLGLTSADTVAQTASQCFDISVWQFLAPLLVGGRVRIVSDEIAHDAPRLLELIDREAVSVVEVVPSVLVSAFGDNADATPAPPSLAALRWLVVTGEAAPVALCRRWLRAYPRTALMNGYGPTECSDDVTHHVMTAPPPEEATQVPIGRPVANMRIYVLDRARNPTPIGVPGELCVGGIGVGRGYLGDPARTAEAFGPDPFTDRPGARLYRTGDLARWRADGSLEFLGRLDHQVKIRGFRIELGEIEAALARHPAVREAVVVAREDRRGERRLAAYVVARGGEPAVSELRSFLARTLPDYMVPESVVVLPALPLTSNGKVDRRALPEPELPARATGAAPPRTPTEDVIANVWADVLGLERVGIQEDFFELGGHSLLATRVVARLRQAFGIELPVRRMFEAPTVAGLAGHVDEARRVAAPTVALPLRPVPRVGPLPASFAQQRLWFIDQLEPGTSIYNIPLVLELRGALDVPALEASLGEVVGRHEALRTTFPAEGGRPVQHIEPPGPLSIPVVDLRGLEPAVQEVEARRLAVEEGSRPFDLAHGPLLRVTLLRLEAETHHLLLTTHHIVVDGWSLEVLFRELLAAYTAFTAGRTADLPPLSVQYADVSEWQRGRLEDETLAAQLEPWRRRLSGVPQLELSTDYPRPAVATAGRGAALSRVLPSELAAGLQTLSRRQGVTLFMTLLAGFTALLGRYSGQDDIAVGVPVAGRTRPEMEPLIGLFVNTLVLRTSLADDPTVGDLLHRVRHVALEAYTHQEVPFERLVQALQPVRDPGRNPLFQVLFSMFEARTPLQSELPGLSVRVASTEHLLAAYEMGAKFDLSLSAWNLDGTIGLRLVYNADLFAASTMERLLHHLEWLLTAAVATPEASIAALPLLTDAEQEQLLVRWNGTGRLFPADRCLHELFEAVVRRTPEAVAVTFQDRTLTYAALNERANRVAHRLRSLGVGPEVAVGICVERSFEMLIGLLAILKAGGAYVPLDPDLPRQRLSYMLADAGVRIVVTQQRLERRLPAVEMVLCLDAEAGLVNEPSGNPDGGARPDSLAYVLYTSGSTGQPKGTMIEHRSLVNYVTWTNEALFRAPVETIPTVFKFTFDGSLKQLFSPLVCGRSVWVLPDEVATDPEALLRVIGSRSGVGLNCVPSLWRAVLDALAVGVAAPPAGSLVAVMLGGEAMTADLVARSFAAFPDLEIWNVYGPTETTCNATAGRVERGGPVTIGRPIANTQVFILDERQQPVPVGVPGELYVAGVGLARGYLGRPELTAERFVRHPFSAEPDARLYRTGDRARYLSDGRIEFLGRRDHQVKIRGFRIELEEIEATLRRHPDIREAVVVAGAPGGGDPRLVGYVVPTATMAPGGRELRQWLRASLPDYMVPSAFVTLSALPTTSAGKVDRASLPPPPPIAADARVLPRTPMETLVAGIWREVLGLDAVGIEDNFFELGGHSLLATQVTSRLRVALHTDVPLRTLFEASTLEELAAMVELRHDPSAAASAPPLVPVERTAPLSLSFQQERLWFFDQFEPGSATFNMSLSLQLRGPLDTGILRRCLAEIWRRHESLRTTFEASDGRPWQRIAPPGEVPLLVTDLGDLDASGRRAELERRAIEQSQQPFDLARGPLVRVQLFRLADAEHILVLTAHHSVADGWSFGIVVRELKTLYPAFARGAPSPLVELPIQYADYAAWQRRALDGAGLASSLSYWRQALAGAPPLQLPTDRPRPARQTFRGAGVPLMLSSEVSEGLRALGRGERATVFMTLLAALQALLSRHTGQEDIVIGAPVAGRTRPEMEPLVGFFLNTLALRGDLSGDPTFREILGRVRDTALAALANQDVPFEKVLETVRPERDLSRTPLFQVFFNLLNFPHQLSPTGSALDIRPLTADLRSLPLELPAKFDLSLYASDQSDRIGLFLVYNAHLFEPTTATTLLGQLELLLTAVVEAPETRLSALPLVSDAERGATMLRPARPFPAFPRPERLGSIPDRFRAMVAEHGDRTAVESRGTVWTYRELDAVVRRVAGALRAAAGPGGGRVGLLLEHDAPMVAAVLGVLEAGHAYVPLDPLYPRDRLAFMLADAEAAVLVTNARNVALARALAGASLPIVNLDALEADEAAPVDARVVPEAVAYILYTSGSTGQPKGVVQSHRNVLHHIGVYANNLHLGPGDRLALLASFSFDAAVMDLFGALLSGACLCLQDVREEGVDGLAAWLADERITIYHSTPTLYRALLVGLPEAASFPDVRVVVLGGEEVVRRDVELYRRHFSPDCLFVNGLGPTESTVSFQQFIDRRTPLTGWSVPVGLAVVDTELVLLDPEGRVAPLAGEIGIRSAHVALEYWRRPELTAAAFLPDPDGGDRRIYRTGDLGRLRPEGTLEFLGRRDDQVKIRGFRIEPAEVESVLDTHPGVRRSVVVAREDDGDGERYLAAYLVPAGEPAPAAAELHAYVRDRLPAYMVPSVFVMLEALPLTPSGKVDRRGLPAPDHLARAPRNVSVAPRTAMEAAVAEIWSEVLGVEPIGVEDNFFELGGHSLMATRVLSRLRARLHVDVPLRALFEAPTVAALAERVEAQRAAAAAADDREEIEL